VVASLSSQHVQMPTGSMEA